ncbi:hypothetical protein WR25_15264 isoform E [Diploscapter pachys]|uniref:Piwi domain-containing protein n=1 Tax=Diploscapter pachys TaxID=2018661 RepID=A0A2A2KUH7_9BILA|nr:hypothetical protein WR25_15264 isoform E [Diploscapter pachys]
MPQLNCRQFNVFTFSFAKFQRMRAVESLLKLFIKKFPAEFPSDKCQMATDAANMMISFVELPKADFSLEVPVENIASATVKAQLSKKCTKVIMKVQFIDKVNIKLEGESEEIRGTQQALEVITSSDIIRSEDYFVFANKFFPRGRDGDQQIGEGKCVKTGFEKNVRISADPSAGVHDRMAMLQIDAKASPFFQEAKLVDYCIEIVGVRSAKDLEWEVINKPFCRDTLKRQLKDLVVTTTHLTNKNNVIISGIHNETAAKTMFKMRDGTEMSVADYYQDKYKMRLNCGLLVVEKRPQGKTFHPIELLDLPRGQRVSHAKTTPMLTEQMIKICQMPPLKLKQEILNQLEKANIRQSAVIQSSGIEIGRRLMKVSGKVLEPPLINYGNDTVQLKPGQGGWKFDMRSQFLKPARIDGDWMFVVFERCTNNQNAKYFVEQISRVANMHGMQLDDRRCRIDEWRADPPVVIENFARAVNNGIKFIMFLTKQKMDDVHHTMKLQEARQGVPTQHLSLQIFNKATGDRGAMMVLGNLVLKTNLKLGGINHEIVVSPTLLRSNPSAKDFVSNMFPKNRMFIGLDVSHAGPMSFAERALNMPAKDPSVVGMSFTLSTITEVRGCYWMQEPRLQTIDRLGEYLLRALELYYATAKRLPDDIVIFRSGLSEGEFRKAIGEVKKAAEHAFPLMQAKNNKKTYDPSMSVIVIQLGSNYRLFQENVNPRDRAMDQNVPSGTTIDCKAVHPAYNEFVQVSQKAIQGTARPVRATLVLNEEGTTGRKLGMDELEHLTYYAAYGHQIVASPTGRPAILYSAAELAKRGRNNWKEMSQGDGGDNASMASSGSGGRGGIKHDGEDSFFERISDQLESKLSIRTHYWA